MNRNRAPLRLALVVVLVTAVAALGGCGAKHSPSSAATASVPARASAPSAREAAEDRAVAAYRGLWLSMAQAGEVPDPDAPELRQYATGDALARVVSALVTYKETGVVTRGAPVINPRVASVSPADSPTQVNLVDCGDSTNWTKHKKPTGELVANDPRGRRTITAVVKVVDGVWKVTSFDVGDIGSC